MKKILTYRLQISAALLSLVLVFSLCAVTVPIDVNAGVVRVLSGFDADTGYADQAYSDAKCSTYICVDGPEGTAKLKVSARHNGAGLSVANFSSVSRTVTLTGSVENDLYDIRLMTASANTSLTPKTNKYLMVDFDVSFILPAHYVYDPDEMEITLRTKADTLVTRDCFSYELDTNELALHRASAGTVTMHCHVNLCNMGAIGVQLSGVYNRVYNTSATVHLGRKKHRVSFDANGEAASCDVEPRELICGSMIGELPGNTAVSREGCRLIGWFDQSEGGTEYTAQTMICEDTTLYAHWFKNLGNFDLSGVYEDEEMFQGDTLITGGSGTSYDQEQIDSGTAHIDRAGEPGYFTEGQVR